MKTLFSLLLLAGGILLPAATTAQNPGGFVVVGDTLAMVSDSSGWLPCHLFDAGCSQQIVLNDEMGGRWLRGLIFIVAGRIVPPGRDAPFFWPILSCRRWIQPTVGGAWSPSGLRLSGCLWVRSPARRGGTTLISTPFSITRGSVTSLWRSTVLQARGEARSVASIPRTRCRVIPAAGWRTSLLSHKHPRPHTAM